MAAAAQFGTMLAQTGLLGSPSVWKYSVKHKQIIFCSRDFGIDFGTIWGVIFHHKFNAFAQNAKACKCLNANTILTIFATQGHNFATGFW